MQAATKYAFLTIFVLTVTVVAACSPSASPSTEACPEGWDKVIEYHLYFGRSDATGAPDAVSDEAWAQFLSDTVTPRFPDGLTVTDGAGQWRNDAGEILKEQAKVLTILVWPDDTAQQRLNEIAAEYESRFNQDSVLLTSVQSCASFS